ncbi:MAG: amidohydrolase/deacetylase family metallohydrolase [Chloroflexi bacterium]|nr:MAG: amidohydrolase/deacetylase family metallohydrolase [Chloroflexota bacterium]
MHFDLLIKGGELVDPGTGRHGFFDIGIFRGLIASVDRSIPAAAALRTINATGMIVTPGLVDMHTHVYRNATFWGIHADPVAARTGVTTWLDVGSAGSYNFQGFREWIAKPSMARLYALLNISSIGLTARTWELANLNYCDVDLCTKMIEANADLILGVKVRIDRLTTGGSGIEPLRRAREVADRVQRPMMVHIGGGPPSLDEVLVHMRPGDILTHCFTGHNMRIVDDAGRISDAVKQAWGAGIVMDIGHGAGSFSFETAQSMIGAGYLPDVISSDIHQLSIHGPLFELPTCMSKFLALGVSLVDVIRAATVRPAQVMGMANHIGALRVGAPADVAMFEMLEGDFSFYDVHMNRRNGRQFLRNTLTIVNGREMARQPDGQAAPWIDLSEDQRNLIKWGHTPAAFGACL